MINLRCDVCGGEPRPGNPLVQVPGVLVVRLVHADCANGFSTEVLR